MAANSSQLFPSQAVIGALRVPVGHIVVSGRWMRTDLVTLLQSSVQVQYEDNLGVVDFHPSSRVGVIYVSEADVIGSTAYKTKCARLRKANKVRGVVLVECTPLSEQYYENVQTVCGLEMGLSVIPITGREQAASVLTQMVNAEGRPESNIFKRSPPLPNKDDAILATLQTVPGLGAIKAKQLLAKFKSLHGVSQASLQDLTQVVGQACAQDIWQFFHGSGR